MEHPLIKYVLKNQVIAGILLIIFILLMLELKEILILVFLSYTIMAALIPFIRLIESRGVPKTLAVLFTYILVVGLIILLIVPLIPFFTKQIQSFTANFPGYLSQAASMLGIKTPPAQISQIITSEFTNLQSSAFTVTTKVFGGFFSTLAVVVISFYLSLNHNVLRNSFTNLFPKDTHKNIISAMDQVEGKLGAWVRGQAVLSISVGIITAIALSLIGLNYVLPLAVIAGILEIIPTIGPIVSAIPAVIIAFIVSPTLALTVVFVYICVQFFENHVLVPNIMQKSVGLNPVIIIITIMIGGKLLGILGALLSIPFVSMLVIIFKNSKSA